MTGNCPWATKKGHSITVFRACQRDNYCTEYPFDIQCVIVISLFWIGIISDASFIAFLHKHKVL